MLMLCTITQFIANKDVLVFIRSESVIVRLCPHDGLLILINTLGIIVRVFYPGYTLY